MSFIDSRYLYDPGLAPGRAGPLDNRTPAGAWNTFEENGHRCGSNSILTFPEFENHVTWSPGSSATTSGITPISANRSTTRRPFSFLPPNAGNETPFELEPCFTARLGLRSVGFTPPPAYSCA